MGGAGELFLSEFKLRKEKKSCVLLKVLQNVYSLPGKAYHLE